MTITGLAQETYVVSAARIAVTCFLLNVESICGVLSHPLDDTIKMMMRGDGVHYHIDMSEQDLAKTGGSVRAVGGDPYRMIAEMFTNFRPSSPLFFLLFPSPHMYFLYDH